MPILKNSNAAYNPDLMQAYVPSLSVSPAFAFFHGIGSSRVGKNFALGGTDAQVYGLPPVTRGVAGSSLPYATFTANTNFLQTATTEAANMTLFSVARLKTATTTPGTGSPLIGTFDSGMSLMVLGYANNLSKPGAQFHSPIGSPSATGPWENDLAITSDQELTWGIYVSRWSSVASATANVNMATMLAPTANQAKTQVNTSATQFIGNTGALLQVGSTPQARLGYFSMPSDHFLDLGFQGALTDDDIQDVLTDIRSIAGYYGVSI